MAAAEDAVAWAGGVGFVRPLHLPTTPRSLALLTSTIVRMEKNDSSGPGLIFMRLALTPAQAQEHGLLDADGKAEVDAVPVPVRPSKRSKSAPGSPGSPAGRRVSPTRDEAARPAQRGPSRPTYLDAVPTGQAVTPSALQARGTGCVGPVAGSHRAGPVGGMKGGQRLGAVPQLPRRLGAARAPGSQAPRVHRRRRGGARACRPG